MELRVVVTGGAGFIGYWTVRELLRAGHEARVVDNLSRATFKDELEGMGVPIHRVDVRDLEALVHALSDADAVVHLAALISVEESAERPVDYHETNVTGTLNVLLASVRSGVRRVIYSSSAAVYGPPVRLPVDEDHPTRPISVYGATKLAGEAYCRAFHEDSGLQTVILRYFNVYGPGQSPEYAGVIVKFSERLSKGLPPVVNGDGLQFRDFVHVLDVARANLLALESGMGFGVYNVGTGTPTRILDLARLMMRLWGVEGEPEFAPPRPGDIRESVADVSRIRRELGFEPSIGLEEGLRGLIPESAER